MHWCQQSISLNVGRDKRREDLAFTQLCLNNSHNKTCENECILTRRLAREMVYAVDSASCWQLILSAVAFLKSAVSLARFLFSC